MSARPDDVAAYRLVRRLAAVYALGCATVAILLLAPAPPWAAPAVAAARASGLGGILLGSLLLAETALAATTLIQQARVMPSGMPGRAARRPQAIVVPLGTALAAAAAWWLRAGPTFPIVTPATMFFLGGASIVVSFILLVAERTVAARGAALPEREALGKLVFLPVVLWPLAGCLAIAGGVGLPYTGLAATALAGFVTLAGVELAVRASANWFLPPADPERARAAIESLVASLARPAWLASGGVAAPLRNHFGIDFSRSWALAYMRAAALPVLAVLLLIGWGLSGVALVEIDQRGINERFGAPVAVMAPGIHLTLPWPLGRVRRVEDGVVHATALGEAGATGVERTAAEAAPPGSADRLWEQSHPSEVDFLIASRSDGSESFQSVSADMRVLWRFGLTDADAIRAAYAVANPDALVRAAADRLIARFFAGRPLADVLGAGRETVANGLRDDLQRSLTGSGAGIEVLAVVIEAVHPPAGAAEAYHAVQAAEIMSRESVAAARGRAIAEGKRAQMMAFTLTDAASGMAAETTGAARIDSRRFAADREAASVGGEAFVLERYLANLAVALPKSPLVIVDHRLSAPDGPVLDLRPLANPARAATADED